MSVMRPVAPTVTAVVLRGDDVLLIRRSDTLAWTPIMKILDPGEQPAAGAGREVAEETGVSVEVESLAWVRSTGLSVHMNGDEAYYLDHLFRCRYVSALPTSRTTSASTSPGFPRQTRLIWMRCYIGRIACAVEQHAEKRFEVS